MTTSTPPAWKWLDECEVPVQVYQHVASETPSDAKLSIHSHKLPESDAFRERNDSGTEPGMSSFTTRKLDNAECDCTAQLPDSVINAAPSHRIGTCYLDPDTGETVMPADFFGEKELRWRPDKTTAPETSSSADSCVVESCPECGGVTDIEYGAVMDRGVDMNEEPAVETHEDLQGKCADKMVDKTEWVYSDCEGVVHGRPNGPAVATLVAEGCRDPDVIPKRETVPDEETLDVPFKTQSWLFESLCEVEIEKLHDLIDDHHDLIIEMARDRFELGFCEHGSAMYSWSPERRLDETLQELADAVVYPTSGPIE